MLAGRKLLLADDSATIQKVIDLTFADEGVQVVSVGNGQEAIDRLPEINPDVVLVDVFMPAPNGYEVCEYVKTNEQFKHIPVMLLVGSFEPFDEAEARRVGADDILTKPFQSIRRLIDRVGALVSSPPVEKERPTAELPKPEAPAEEERLDAHELAVTTADTARLSEESIDGTKAKVEQPVSAMKSLPEENMETRVTESRHDSQADAGDVLLDLGEIEAVSEASDDFVLELDDDVSDAEVVSAAPYGSARTYEAAPAYDAAPAYEAAPVYEATPVHEARPFVEPEVVEAPSYRHEVHDSFADTHEIAYAAVEPEPQPQRQSIPEAVASVSAPITPGELSPEIIDAIARRAVELMSDKVIREIAWEVVPDLAELLIKKQLEETK
ncbi:MAG TPA: response regulator [Pyrinomonadaceae bacterium]|nr:response regulator [Pyrinomonadaceae bacterium]